jgi:peptidoglycan-associated lipoprotein
MNKWKSPRLAPVIFCLLLLMLAGGCKKKAPVAAPPPPPPPPPPAAAPTVTLTANPTTIERGGSSTLTWSSTNATNVAIDQGIGDVSTSGTRSVSPSSSTTYTVTARGEGGTASATARITVTAPPPPPPPAVVTETLDEQFSKRVRDVYFDYDKSDIRDDQKSTLSDAADFLKANPSLRFTVEGHCDERGSEEYNLGLGDRRANAVKNYLISLGIGADRMNPISYGKERTQCREATEECYQRNRRGHFVLTAR